MKMYRSEVIKNVIIFEGGLFTSSTISVSVFKV